MRIPAMLAAIVLVCAASEGAPAQQAMRSPHGDLSLPCASCHTSGTWTPARVSKEFEHAPRSFPLAAGHAGVSCTSCHRTLEFEATSTACATCHVDAHGSELGADCARCHTTRSFIDRAAMLRTHQSSRFPLVASHLIADCEGCHRPTNGRPRFAGTPVTCDGCHRAEALAPKDPDHVAAGFVQACSQCHIPVAWNRARFEHAGTAFPLTGAHRAQSCATCHGDGVYAGRSTECVSCHQADYDATRNPAHAPAGFSTACATCHSTTQWLGASFDHDARFFPVFSGEHRGVWSSCATCHTTPSNYAQFSCLGCHEHRQDEMDGKHDEVSGYVWESRSCYACHPRGRKP